MASREIPISRGALHVMAHFAGAAAMKCIGCDKPARIGARGSQTDIVNGHLCKKCCDDMKWALGMAAMIYGPMERKAND